MTSWKIVLFTLSMLVMVALFAAELQLNNEWHRMEQEADVTEFRHSQASREMENRIFRVDMLLATFGFINFIVIASYLVRNYQHLLDKWRKFRGMESKPLLATLNEEEAKDHRNSNGP